MFEILYMLSFTLMRSGAIIGDRLDRGLRSDLPLYPTMLRLITGMAGLVGLCWFIYGFFLFSWWLPLISLLANITVSSYAMLSFWYWSGSNSPSVCILTSYQMSYFLALIRKSSSR